MARFDDPRYLMETLSAPLGDLIASVGEGVASAQEALDLQTIENFKRVFAEGNEAFEELRKLGYIPTWYHLPKVEAEMNVALTVAGSGSTIGAASTLPQKGFTLYAAPLDAGYSNKYNFQLAASTKLKFTVVPVPPSARAEDIVVDVPDLVGMTIGDARKALEEIRLLLDSATGTGVTAKIATQNPPAGDRLLRGGKVTVTVA